MAKRSLEQASIKWVQDEYRKLTTKRADGMAAFITQELQFVISERQRSQIVDSNAIENLIDRAWDRGPLPVSKEAVAFEIWNGLHILGVEIGQVEKCRYVPKMEGGPAPARLRAAFRTWYGN
jgi:hypothetical protein